MTRYLDASALVKLFVVEAETTALRAHLSEFPMNAVTSLVGVAETSIAVARRGLPDDAARAVAAAPWLTIPHHNVAGFDVTPQIAQSAAALGAALGLRTLDAVHVATAEAIRGSLTEFVTYDRRMIAACQALHLPVVSPST